MQKKLAAKRGILRRGVLKALRLSGESIYARALENVSGKVLHVRTGTLRRRLGYFLNEQSFSLSVGSPVIYAAIHEYGGTVQIPEIRPVKRRALRWINQSFIGPIRMTKGGKPARRGNAGAFIFARSARAHTIRIPARPFLRPALNESIPDVKRHFEDKIGEALQEAQ